MAVEMPVLANFDMCWRLNAQVICTDRSRPFAAMVSVSAVDEC